MVGLGIEVTLEKTQKLIANKPEDFEGRVEEIHNDYLKHRELINAEASCFPEVRKTQSEYEFLYAKFDANLI
jgi:hypothetical protein